MRDALMKRHLWFSNYNLLLLIDCGPLWIVTTIAASLLFVERLNGIMEHLQYEQESAHRQCFVF
jgi:hypothetical protein